MRFRILAVVLAALLPAIGAHAAGNIITATVSVTNAAGTTNGQTITIGADVRTWTNSVQVPAVQVLTNNTAGGAATNLFNHLATYGFAGLTESHSGTNGIALRGSPGVAFTVTLSDGWGAVSYATNYLTNAFNVRMPLTVEAPAQQTNIASMLASALESSTNVLSATDTLLGNYASLSQAQAVTGNKAFTGTSNYVAGGFLSSPTTTNLVNYGNALSSPGSGVSSEQFGSGSSASSNFSTALGFGATASGYGSTALGYGSSATGYEGAALGVSAAAGGTNSTAIGTLARVFSSGSNATAVGYSSIATNVNSTAVGAFAKTTIDNQVMLGSSGISTFVNNYLSVGAGATIANGVTNLLQTGTNTVAGDLAFPRYAITTLANGVNAAVPVGTNIFVEVSGPTGSFSIDGINGAPNRDGKILILLNQTGQNMTIKHQSGSDPTAANRIVCLTGADKSLTGNSAATLIYSSSAARWVCLSLTQ